MAARGGWQLPGQQRGGLRPVATNNHWTAVGVASHESCNHDSPGPLVGAGRHRVAPRAGGELRTAVEAPLAFRRRPHLRVLSLDGNATVSGITTDVDVPFKDLIKDLSFGGMLLGTARKGRFGFALNGVYARVSPDDSVGGVDIDTTSDLASLAAAPFYRVVDWTYRTGADGQPHRFILEPYAGARWNYVRAEIEIRGGNRVDQSQSWVDPIVGTRTT